MEPRNVMSGCVPQCDWLLARACVCTTPDLGHSRSSGKSCRRVFSICTESRTAATSVPNIYYVIVRFPVELSCLLSFFLCHYNHIDFEGQAVS